jgi:MoxR-like ATPase
MKEPYRNFIANDFIVHNTAKSMLAMKVFNGIDGAEVYRNQFTRMQDDSYVFGPQLLEEFKQGKIIHNIENTLITAHFGFLDEFFNASEETLVATLEPLNERTFTRPFQQVKCPLITAIMTTNQERETEKELRAVYDRIMFTSDVKELADVHKRIDMYRDYMEGKIEAAQPVIQFKTIEEVLTKFDEFVPKISRGIFFIYDRIVSEYEAQANVKLSPRKKNKMLKIMKASAFLRGADEVTIDDIETIKFGLVHGGDIKGIGYFDTIFLKVKQSLAQAEVIQKMEALFEDNKTEKDGALKLKVLVGLSKKCEKMVSEFQNNAASEILVPMLESLKLKVEKYRKEVDPGNSMEG